MGSPPPIWTAAGKYKTPATKIRLTPVTDIGSGCKVGDKLVFDFWRSEDWEVASFCYTAIVKAVDGSGRVTAYEDEPLEFVVPWLISTHGGYASGTVIGSDRNIGSPGGFSRVTVTILEESEELAVDVAESWNLGVNAKVSENLRVEEAPSDGKLYVRKDGDWLEIPPNANPGPYLPLSGGTMTGQLTNNGGYYQSSGGWFYAQAGAIELRCTGSNIVVDCDAAINMRATNGINAESQLNLSQGIQSAGTLIINSNASTQITGSQGVYVYSPAYFTSSVQLESNRIFSKDTNNDDSLVIRGGNNPMIHLGSSNIHGYIYSNRIQANNFMSSEMDILQGGSGFQFYTNAPVEYRPWNQNGNSREAIKILTNAGGIGFYSTDGHGPSTSINNGSARFGGSFLEVQGDLNVGNNIYINQGTAYKPNGGMWENSSDARLKTDVSEYSDGLEKLTQLRPIRFRFNDRARMAETKKLFVGLAAEQVKEVMPTMVGSRKIKLDYEDKEPTDVLTVDASELIYTMINAFKQIDERLRTLEEFWEISREQ